MNIKYTIWKVAMQTFPITANQQISRWAETLHRQILSVTFLSPQNLLHTLIFYPGKLCSRKLCKFKILYEQRAKRFLSSPTKQTDIIHLLLLIQSVMKKINLSLKICYMQVVKIK